jgi:hypothetical protein
MNAASFLAIASAAYVCGAFITNGFALSLIYQLYRAQIDNSKFYVAAWTFFACLGIAAGTLGATFTFISLVLGDSTSGTFVVKSAVYVCFLLLGCGFSFAAAMLFNRAARDGRIQVGRAVQ